MKTILITGNMGYVGPEVVRHLRERRPDSALIGLDTGYFAACLLENTVIPERFLDRQYFADVREVTESTLEGVHAIVHLAAISNDPMGNAFEAVTRAINEESTLRLAAAAKRAGVGAFVLASSCSVYGFAESGTRDEHSEVQPLTAYARSKVSSEAGLQALAGPDFQVTCLRFATACGFSPRLRLDLVLNDFVAAALVNGVIQILSDGSPWRPLIDVQDMARAIDWAVGRPHSAGGSSLIVNAGSDVWNYQVRDLAAAVARHIPGVRVDINSNAAPDKRSYRVNFELFRRLAPGHQPQATLDSSIERLKQGLESAGFRDPDFRKSNLMRLNMLASLRRTGYLDEDLRWSGAANRANSREGIRVGA
jgi:nucleoside-diphosphate-sugar epimerase